MKTLLISPEFPDTYWGFRHALKLQGKRSAFPPLGLLTVAALLPPSWERRLVDMNVAPLRSRDIEWAEIVLVSAMLAQKDSLRRVVELCRSRGKRVVVGGPYVTTSAEELPEADHLFIGEAETTLPEFIRDLERGAARPIYQASERPALAATPVPEYGLADLNRYNSMSLQYSRGCPFNCEFCDITEIYGRAPRTKSCEQVVRELDALYTAGWRGTVFFVDDNFIGHRRNVKAMLPELARWQERHGRPFTFITEASVNLADDEELLEGMRQAGFRRVFVGIETPVEESLQEAGKTQNLRGDLLTAIRTIQGHGIEVMGGFIVGFDNDPEDIFERQMRFIRESAIPMAMVGLLTALPGTQLWRRLKREDRLLTESSGNNTDGSLNFVPKMDAAHLVEGYRSLLRTLYSSREYYHRVLEQFRRIAPTERTPRRDGPIADTMALARIFYALGVRDGERGEFWRYMYRVVTEHRQRFGLALRFAATGYHFRKLIELE